MEINLLPSDAQSENLVLASLMTDLDALPAIVPVLEPDDFSLEANRRIYGAISEIWRGGGVPDRVTVARDLQAAGKLESVGGVGHLVELEVGMPQLFNLDRFIGRLRDLAIRRRMLKQLTALEQKICDQSLTIEEFSSDLQAAHADAMNGQLGDDGLLTFAEFLEASGGQAKFLAPDDGRIIQTPWPALNDMLSGGWRACEFTVLAARPGLGKSAAAGQIAYQAAAHGANVDVFSLEMRNAEIWKRMLSSVGHISSRRLRTGVLRQEDEEPLAFGLRNLKSMGALRISEKPHRTIAAIERVLRKAKASRRLDLVVVDYLQLLRGSRSHKSRVEEVSDITREMKLLASELEFTLIVLAQLNRESVKENREPDLHDLRECGSIEQDADVVLFLYQKPSDKLVSIRNASPCPTKLLVRKQRNGPMGTVECLFNARYVTLEEAEPEEPCD